ncbi:hypothetical protein V500_04429 [Pseudogymnoascus sp. VKM F-4518 (FW-2643)]|nr:hypothetical protein V500_04429 [Pseudogymnoascus sp. VKM F-4518 (FW-2643)]
MTTLIRTRNPLETLSMNPQPQRRRSKRLATYDESDGDFNFTRGSKRTKTAAPLEAVAETEPAPSRSRRQEKTEDDAPKDLPRRPSKRKMSFSATPARPEPKVPSPKKDARDTTRRKKESAATQPEPRRGTRRSTRSSLENARRNDAAPAYDDDEDAIEMVGGVHTVSPPPPEPEAQSITRTPILTTSHATTIALPFSDTPVLNRNKALRQTTSRRSSLGLRGRRASSLIDSGHTATPHAAVPADEFYKHIESSLPEPRRMRQLLTWCGERALGERPGMGEGSAAVLAARHIQEQVLKEFSERSELSDWFARAPGEKKVVVVPNPLNVGNAARVAELEERVKRLRKEKAELLALSAPPPSQPPRPQKAAPLDPALLPASSAPMLDALHANTTLAPRVTARLNAVRDRLELATDVFAHAVHGLEQDGKEMDGVAGRLPSSSLSIKIRMQTDTPASSHQHKEGAAIQLWQEPPLVRCNIPLYNELLRIRNPRTPRRHQQSQNFKTQFRLIHHTMKPKNLLRLGLLAASTHATTHPATSLLDCLSTAKVPFITSSSPTWPLFATPFNLRVIYIPVAIVIPVSTSQVAAAVACGAAYNVKVTAKAGGHSYESLSSGGEDGHLVVELAQMAGVSLNRETWIATIGPGARLGDVAVGIYNQGKRAFSHGTCPGVGLGGHVLHGGYGMSSRTHGLALDWVDSMTVVLANASVVDCSATVHPSLFWAMLGAGSGFGITTEFRFRTYEAPKAVTWFSAALLWDVTTAVEGMEELELFTRYRMSPELNMRLMASVNGSSLDGVFYGDRAGLEGALGPLLEKVNGSIAKAGTTGWIGGLEHFSESDTGLVVPKPYDIHQVFYAKSLTLTGLNGTSAENFVDYWFNVAYNVDRILWFQLDLHGGAHAGVWEADNGVASAARGGGVVLGEECSKAAED